MNRSEYLTTVSGTTVFMGFIHVQGLEEQALDTDILENRKRLGEFADLVRFYRTYFSRNRTIKYPDPVPGLPVHRENKKRIFVGSKFSA